LAVSRWPLAISLLYWKNIVFICFTDKDNGYQLVFHKYIAMTPLKA
jgi:hypothetical protein